MIKSILVFFAAMVFAGAAFADPPRHSQGRHMPDRRTAYYEQHEHERSWTYNREHRFHPRWRHHRHHTVRIYRYQGREVLFGILVGAAVVAILTQAQYEREFGRSPY